MDREASTTPPEKATGSGRLLVRSRQITSEGGSAVTEFTVYCPFRQRSLDLEQCEACFAYDGTVVDMAGTPNELACARIAPAVSLPDVAETAARDTLEHTPVSRVMARQVVCVHPELPLGELAGILLGHKISGLPVVDEAFRPLGMVTKTDLIRHGFEIGEGEEFTVRHGPGFAGRTCCVAEIMSPSVVSIGERGSLIEAAQLMISRGVHRVVVTSRDGRIVGIVSSIDVLRWISRELPSGEGVAGAVET
jgi:CBS domain-containing protein